MRRDKEGNGIKERVEEERQTGRAMMREKGGNRERTERVKRRGD